MHKIVVCIQLLILSPIIFFAIILRFFFKIQIIEIETRAIGHMSLPIEVFLSEISNKIHKKGIYLAFQNPTIANKFLFKKIKKKFLVLPRFVVEPIYLFFNSRFIYNLIGKKFTSDFRHWKKRKIVNLSNWQEQDIYDVLPKTKPSISFDNSEIILGNKLLSKLGINTEKNQYVCLHHRTPHFFFKNKIISEFKYNLRDLRNENYLKTFDYLKANNLKVVSMGEKIKNQDIDEVIYYNTENLKDDFLDIFLLFNCKFMISDGSGISNVPLLNRRKRLYINFAQIFSINLSDSIYTPFILPKKFKKLDTNKYLPYSVVLKKKLSEITYVDELNKLGYDIEDNSEDDIFNATKEMNYFLDNNDYLYYDSNLEKKFNKLLEKNTNSTLKKSKIPFSYLKSNLELFD
tara:strand:+ start:316 stop:1524 length:1209 start_codon:yes stop_codon:yes gene_type:complete